MLIMLSDVKHEINFQIEKESLKRYESFAQLFIINPSLPELRLKIDFVNDIAEHYGDFEYHKQLGRIDGWQNILSNKITAIFRFEPKDVADIWVIAKNQNFDWKIIIKEAKTKEAGVEPEVIFNILKSFPIEQLNLVKWVLMPNFNSIQDDIGRMADDILYGRENSIRSGTRS